VEYLKGKIMIRQDTFCDIDSNKVKLSSPHKRGSQNTKNHLFYWIPALRRGHLWWPCSGCGERSRTTFAGMTNMTVNLTCQHGGLKIKPNLTYAVRMGRSSNDVHSEKTYIIDELTTNTEV